MESRTPLAFFFTEPYRAFAALKERPTFLFPLLLSVLGSAVVLVWYYSSVDIGWMIEQIINNTPDMKPEARVAMQQVMSRNVFLLTTLASIVIGVPIIAALQALYYMLVGKILNVGVGFKAWFGFVCWSSIPRILTLPLMVVQILRMEQGRLMPNELNIASLNYLVWQLPASNKWASFLSNVDLTILWSMVLLVVGWRVWSQRSWFVSTLAALLPHFLIFGGWALYLSLKG